MYPSLFLAVVLAAAPAPKLPSVAVTRLTALSGVNADVAELLSGNLATKIRNSGRFDRVVTSAEIETLMGFEKQKQLMQCDGASCMAELAAALGVDYVVSGSIGRVGDIFLFNASLINTRTSVAESSVSESIAGENVGGLVRAMDKIVAELLGQKSNVPGAPTRQPPPKPDTPPASKPAEPVAVATPTTTAPSSPEATQVAPAADAAPAEPSKGSGVLWKVMLGMGVAGLGAGLLVLLVAAGSAASSGVVFAGAQLGWFNGMHVGPALLPAFVGTAVAAGVAVVVALAVVVAGAGVLGGGVVLK